MLKASIPTDYHPLPIAKLLRFSFTYKKGNKFFQVRGNLPECDDVRDHAEIVRSIVKNGCESLLPMEPPNTSSFRKLRDSLVMAERWALALEVSLKWGFSTTGVMAAWGISALKAGCFETGSLIFFRFPFFSKIKFDLCFVFSARKILPLYEQSLKRESTI